jgi:hypothetical protein
MNRGYIRLWRKSLEAGWLQNPGLWTFWTWCLLKASHKNIIIMIGFQEIALGPGQFIFGRHKASEELKMSERKIRTCLGFLKKAGNVTIKPTNKYSIITVVNWHSYQGNDFENTQRNDQPPTNKGPHTNTKEHKKNTPDEISEIISLLIFKLFPSPDGKELFSRSVKAISSFRKTGRVSPSVILRLLQKLEGTPEGQILAGMRAYLEREYYKQGKDERYLLGIIRNMRPDLSPIPKLRSTGSSLLDALNQGKISIAEVNS